MPVEGNNPLPYFSMQVITNYIYCGKHYMSVNTAVLPLTTSIDRLFENINLQFTTSSLIKSYMSSIRLEDITSCKDKYMKQVATIWKAVNEYYQGVSSKLFRICRWSGEILFYLISASSKTTIVK